MQTESMQPVDPLKAGALIPATVEPGLLRPRSEIVHGPQLSLGTLLAACHTRWLLGGSVGLLLGLAAASAICHLVPVKYQAVALMRVLPSEPMVLGREDRVNKTEMTTYQKSQIGLLLSSPVLEAAYSERARAMPGAPEQPERGAWLEKELRVGFLEDSDLLRIALSSENAKEAEILVNAVLDSYLKKSVEEEEQERTNRLAELKRIYNTALESLQSKKKEMRLLVAGPLKTVDPAVLTSKQKNSIEEHAAHRREMRLVQTQLRRAKIQERLFQAQLENRGKSELPAALLDEGAESDPRIQQQLAEVEKAKKIANEFKKVAFAGAPRLDEAEKNLKDAQAELDRMMSERRGKLAARLSVRSEAEVKASAHKYAEEVAVLQEHYDAMVKEEAVLRAEAEKLGVSAYDLDGRKTEVEQAESVLKSLRAEVERLQVEILSEKKRISVVHRADVPRVKIVKTRIQASLFGGIAFFCLGVAGVGYREFRTRRIRTSEDVTDTLDVKVIGTLPVMPRRMLSNSPGQKYGRFDCILTESVSYIRAVLLNAAVRDGKNQAIMIASAESGEGKTMLAGHLAFSLAFSGHRTLLVDGDLRRPSLARIFDLDSPAGLCDVFRGELDLSAAVRPSGIAGLSLLPAGNRTVEDIQRLSPKSMEGVVEQLRANYDFVILDSSPLLAVADGLLFAKHTDGVVLCVRPGYSRFPAVSAAREILSASDIPLVGIVVNGISVDCNSSFYRYLLPQEGAA
jgi:succinoglycan biosynthesis transport protein ExoP